MSDPIERFKYFVRERHNILLKKQKGEPKPWTDDKILQQYKFCNVHREDDTVTKWIAENWRDGNTDWYVWFAMAVARFINWPESLEHAGYPVPWNPTLFKQRLRQRKRAGLKVFTGAYIVTSPFSDKIKYVADKVLTPMWKDREKFPKNPQFLENVYEWLIKYNGVGSFMAGQIIADLKYVRGFDNCKDWETFAVSGPGSRRGLNRVCGRNKRERWKEIEWKSNLMILRTKMSGEDIPHLHNQDLQNCLCEFDKYERVRLGEGKPRSRYPGEKDAEEKGK